MAQYADIENNVYIQTTGNNALIRSIQNPNDIVHACGPGKLTITLRPVENHMVVRSIGENEFEIKTLNRMQPNDRVPYSFEIGYKDQRRMAVVAFEQVPEEEQSFFGKYQLLVNNNWKITVGQRRDDGQRMPETGLVVNIPIAQSQTNVEQHQALFRVELDRQLPEPQRISVRIRPGDFATMFFASNELLHIRFNGNYLQEIYGRIQRAYVPDPMEWALLPRELSLFENFRRIAFEAPAENLEIFQWLLQLGINALNEDVDIADIDAEFNRYLASEGHRIEPLAIMPPPVDDDV